MANRSMNKQQKPQKDSERKPQSQRRKPGLGLDRSDEGVIAGRNIAREAARKGTSKRNA